MSFYSLLGLEYTSSLAEIRKAYRQKSLLYHPDKQTQATLAEQAKASKRLEEIKEAVETLLDPFLKAKYDLKVKAEEERRKRDEEMDLEDKQLKRQVEEREAMVKDVKKRKTGDLEELERIREEGRRLQEAKSELRNQSVLNSIKVSLHLEKYHEIINNATVMDCSIKIKWEKQEVVDEIRLRNYFTEFGKIEKIIMGKSRSCTLVYKSVEAVYNLVHGRKDHGIYKVKVMGKDPEAFVYIALKRGDDIGMELEDDIKLQSYNRGQEYEKVTLERLKEQQKQRMGKE